MKKILVLLAVSFLFLGCQKGDFTEVVEKTEDDGITDEAGVTVSDSFVIIKTDAGEVRVDIEEATTPMEKVKGLTGRPVIEKGMFFIYDREGDYSFTTLGMEAPIDIIFIDSSEKIVDMKKNVEPGVEVIQSSIPFQFVLETKAGFADEKNIKSGQKVNWFLATEKDGNK